MSNPMELSETVSLIVVAMVLLGVIGVFVRICVRLRRGGGSMTTLVLGATDGFLTKDRSRAAETIVNENAGKKFVDQNIKESK
jgi:hypothetical protein